jgi:multisubunit Na+/H+ antiporter MnhG subunit
MLDWVELKVDEVTTLFQGASVLGAIIMVAVAYYKTRTIVAVIVAAITAGVFLWTINNADWWQERVEEESDVAPPFEPAPDDALDDLVVVVDSPPATTT